MSTPPGDRTGGSGGDANGGLGGGGSGDLGGSGGAGGGAPLGAVGGAGVAADVRQALLDMAQGMRQIGVTARQNNTNFLSDIPYFGIPPAQDKRKTIIPLGETY